MLKKVRQDYLAVVVQSADKGDALAFRAEPTTETEEQLCESIRELSRAVKCLAQLVQAVKA